MTGSPEHDGSRDRGAAGRPDGVPAVPDGIGHDLSGRLDDGRPDPLEQLLRRPAPHLQAPPGAYERIRRSATRRRRARAALGGGAAAAVIAGALYVGGSLTTGGGDAVIGPPAGSSTAMSARPPGPTAALTSPATPPAPIGTTGTTGVPASSPPSSRPATGGTGSAPTPGTPSASPTPSGHGTPMCAAGQLTAALGGGDAGAGNLYRYLVLTNNGTAACHLTGYPGLSLLDASGHQIGQPATRRSTPYQPVVLQPGGSASDTVHTVNQQGTCLPESAQLRIYPPGSLDSLVVPGRITVCDDVFAITPFAPGTTGNPPG